MAEAAKIMRDKDTTSILVTKKDSIEPVGIVTERDILYRVLAQNKDPLTTSLNDIMNYPLIYAEEDLSIKDGICLMRNKNIRRLPIKRTGKDIRCGVLICRDQNNPLLAAKYRNNIDILFYLSSYYYTKSEAMRKERKNKAFPIVRAVENKMYVAKADAVGKQNGFVNFGGSMVVNPECEVIAEAKKGREQILEFYL